MLQTADLDRIFAALADATRHRPQGDARNAPDVARSFALASRDCSSRNDFSMNSRSCGVAVSSAWRAEFTATPERMALKMDMEFKSAVGQIDALLAESPARMGVVS